MLGAIHAILRFANVFNNPFQFSRGATAFNSSGLQSGEAVTHFHRVPEGRHICFVLGTNAVPPGLGITFAFNPGLKPRAIKCRRSVTKNH